jgi:hypothetical protein
MSQIDSLLLTEKLQSRKIGDERKRESSIQEFRNDVNRHATPYLFFHFRCFLASLFPLRSERYAPSLLFCRTTRRVSLQASRRHKLHAVLLWDEKIK